MIFRVMNWKDALLLPLLLLFLALAAPIGVTTLTAPARAQSPVPKAQTPAGTGGDAVLPAGYKEVRWGANTLAVQALRGRALEQIVSNSHVTYLIEAPLPGDKNASQVIKWKFWDNQLTEVQIEYFGPFNKTERREMVYKFESQYGPGHHEERKRKQHHSWAENTDILVAEWWTWEDPFTVQMLQRNIDEKNFTSVRKSRVLEARRDKQLEQERQETRTDRVQEIDLD
ncbi:MAG: hypothetical protein VX498_11110 [Myxococcota bacterium]|nr:hypothetical protein [Myxococcota bacterium]